MEKNTFMGQYSGFLSIGAEEVKKNHGLVSYSARPYSGSEKVENCILLDEKGFLTIRDVRSPAGSEYDCIWDKEDIESAMDRIGKKRSFCIKKISCSNITKLSLPSACKGLYDTAFDGCENLCSIFCFDHNTKMMIDPAHNFTEDDLQKEYTSEKIQPKLVNEIKNNTDNFNHSTCIFHRSIFFFENTPVIKPYDVICYCDGNVYDRFVVSAATKEIHTGSILFGKWVLIPLKDMLIKENGIAKDVPIFAVSGGSIEEYAKKNGNPFTALNGEIPPGCLPYTIKNNNIEIHKKTDLLITKDTND